MLLLTKHESTIIKKMIAFEKKAIIIKRISTPIVLLLLLFGMIPGMPSFVYHMGIMYVLSTGIVSTLFSLKNDNFETLLEIFNRYVQLYPTNLPESLDNTD